MFSEEILLKIKILDNIDTRSEIGFISAEDEDPRDSLTNLAQIIYGAKRKLIQIILTPMVNPGEIGVTEALAKKSWSQKR